MHYPITGNRVTSLLILCSCLLLPGCSILKAVGLMSDEPEPEADLSQVPYEFVLTLSGNEDINPDARLQPSPVRIRLFLADPKDDLGSSSFETLFEFGGEQSPQKPNAVVVLPPGGSKTVTLSGAKSHSQLVIAAAFRDIHSANWLATREIDVSKPGNITATITAASVEID